MLYWKSEEEVFVLYTFSIIHPSSCKWSNSIKETKIEIWKRKYEIIVSSSEAVRFYSKSTAEIKSHKNFLSNNSIQMQYLKTIHSLFLAHLTTNKKNSGTFSGISLRICNFTGWKELCWKNQNLAQRNNFSFDIAPFSLGWNTLLEYFQISSKLEKKNNRGTLRGKIFVVLLSFRLW